jgi:RHH-type rel operon transcriptional repressor/antitoxin RelB
MLALRLPPEIEARLDALAKKTGRTKSFYAREAILEHLEDIEDAYLADERIRTDTGERISLEDVMAEFADDLAANPVEGPVRPARAKEPARPRKQ